MKLNVNTDASIQLTARLEKLSKSAFPSAVRNTLNETAFKTKSLVPKKASQNFTIRQKNLFTRFVLVDKAQGFNVNQMSSKVGIDANTKSKLAEGLEKQEKGGVIQGSKLIAHDKARVSGSSKKKVRKGNYKSVVSNVSKKGKRIKGSKYVMIGKGSKRTIFEVKNKKLNPLYNVRNTDKSRVKSRPFMLPSARLAASKMEDVYKKQAEFQFKKHLK